MEKQSSIYTEELRDYFNNFGTLIHICNISPATLNTESIISAKNLDYYLNYILKQTQLYYSNEKINALENGVLEHYNHIKNIFNSALNLDIEDWKENALRHYSIVSEILKNTDNLKIKIESEIILKHFLKTYPNLFHF